MDDGFIDYVPPQGVISPCIGLCRLDPATGWCLGCGRTGDEIASWPGATDAERRAILGGLDERLTLLVRNGGSAL